MILGATLKNFQKPADPIPFSMPGTCGGHPTVWPRFLEWTSPPPQNHSSLQKGEGQWEALLAGAAHKAPPLGPRIARLASPSLIPC